MLANNGSICLYRECQRRDIDPLSKRTIRSCMFSLSRCPSVVFVFSTLVGADGCDLNEVQRRPTALLLASVSPFVALHTTNTFNSSPSRQPSSRLFTFVLCLPSPPPPPIEPINEERLSWVHLTKICFKVR